MEGNVIRNKNDTLISFDHLSSSPPNLEEFVPQYLSHGYSEVTASGSYVPDQAASHPSTMQNIPTPSDIHSKAGTIIPSAQEVSTLYFNSSQKVELGHQQNPAIPPKDFTPNLSSESDNKISNFQPVPLKHTQSQDKTFATMNPIYLSPTSDIHFNHIPPVSGSLHIPDMDIITSSNFLSTEADRSQDAWIPSKMTKDILIAKNSTPGLEEVDKSLLSLPGIAIKEVFGDPIKNLMQMYMGEEKASQRQSPTASSVTQDDRGLRQLITSDCLHAAVNLTTQLLTVYGQGEGRLRQPNKHTIHSVRLWFTRISLLVKLRRFSLAEVECQPFGNLDSPDLYFEFYPELYGGRKGSMIPFPFRLLVAELPQYLGKHVHALDRLGEILSICSQIIANLRKGLSEDGSTDLKPKEIEHGLCVWRERKVRTLYALTSCAIGYKDFRLANGLIQSLLNEDPTNISGLYSALGRLSLQLGDIQLAQESFRRHLEHSPSGMNYDPVQGLLHSAYIACAENNFHDAKQILQQAQKINPENALIVNNLAVATMFLGDVREAIEVLENAIFGQPQFLHETLVLNLATLYELESTMDHKKKLRLLTLISEHKGDGFNVGALKLQI